MPIRERSGKWHYRFTVQGHEYTGATDLDATERNRTAANRAEAEARRLVLQGRASELRLQVKPFLEAADMFLDWARGEYREHPATAVRLAISFVSLKKFFKGKSVSSITPGDVEDFKSWRRTVHEVRDVTIRHDLHALSGFFRYAIKHNWTRENAVKSEAVPSDLAAVRIHVVTPAEETLYFATCEKLGYRLLSDVATLILMQGCRPAEMYGLRQCDVDLAAGTMTIPGGKSKAAKRQLWLLQKSKEVLARRLSTPGPFVFPSPRRRGKPICKLNNAHQDVLEKTGLAFCLYDLRHTFATRAAAAGMPLATLSAILGHSDIRLVMRYVHPTQAHLDAGMRMLEPAVEKKAVEEMTKERVM